MSCFNGVATAAVSSLFLLACATREHGPAEVATVVSEPPREPALEAPAECPLGAPPSPPELQPCSVDDECLNDSYCLDGRCTPDGTGSARRGLPHVLGAAGRTGPLHPQEL